MESNNPLLCDYETGTCEMPGLGTINEDTLIYDKKQKPVQITYFTDPICSSCWGIEPQLRKLKLEYGAYINIEYRMGGLLPSWDGFNGGGITKPSDVAHHWDEASRYYQMPIDGNVWLEDPLDSSYPPSIAFIAAKMQNDAKADKFLRRIKEMVFTEKKNIAKWENLYQAALQTGLDAERFKQDFEGEAKRLFQADLNFARTMGVRGFPTLFFANDGGEQQILKGFKAYEHFEQMVKDLYPGAKKAMIDTDASAVFEYYPTLTTKEFSVITDDTLEASRKILQGLANDGLLEKVATRNGDLWKKK
ncbi:DsbA family protein [Mucilaginibacter terrigena]|uniref:DsbA family protein n=1 Tax=Mucilaginibacter terrigena TaxID=2492395 RepID=A0A4Q5LR18_9SPHI|nr:DsbA family protein [Mucilaginibacter terrigena]RYU91905.1 DsbA family protein [Mucilaginibacter terrigena]